MRRAVVLLALLLEAADAGAHGPAVLQPGAPYAVEDSTVSRALYGVFETGDELFEVRLDLPRDFALPFEILVPHRDGLYRHRPAFAVVGAGLPPPDPLLAAALPRPLPAGAGAFVEENLVEPRPAIYEFFTRRFFWSSGPVALALPAGSYEIWVWAPGRTTGKFALGFGVEEDIDPIEALDGWATYAW